MNTPIPAFPLAGERRKNARLGLNAIHVGWVSHRRNPPGVRSTLGGLRRERPTSLLPTSWGGWVCSFSTLSGEGSDKWRLTHPTLIWVDKRNWASRKRQMPREGRPRKTSRTETSPRCTAPPPATTPAPCPCARHHYATDGFRATGLR